MSNSDHSDDPTLDPKRRRVLQGLAASGLALGSGADAVARAVRTASSSLPAPQDCGIDHFVIVMMENRSFDHIMGWLPGADGIQEGLSFPDTAGNWHPTHNLAPDYQNCSSADPDHSYQGGRTEANGDAMNGFLLTQPLGDTFPIGYFTRDAVPFYSGCADSWTICDHYHTGILSCTFPNRIYMHAGQTDRANNSFHISTLPTIWDSLKAAGVSARYYFNDAPIIALWGKAHLGIARRYDQFKQDAAAGRLPAVSYIDPAMLGEGKGTSRDDHPYADIRDGQAFLNDVYETLRNSPQWSRTLLIVNYDEWGGFYDHVSPPYAPVTPEEYAATGNDGRLGIRVPCIAIGPRARRAHVETQQFDPNSILNMLAWRFGFAPLGARASSTNFAYALDFSGEIDPSAPQFNVPPGPFGTACSARKQLAAPDPDAHFAEVLRRRAEHVAELKKLREMADRLGFPAGM
jgi:phospholipase C